MAYATPAELADALEIPLTTEEEPLLQSCLDAAASEIDSYFGRPGKPPFKGAPALVVRVNINRAVEWYKAPEIYGNKAFTEVTTMEVPGSSFERHAFVLRALKLTNWGIA